MTNILLSEGSTTKAKEAGNFAFLLTDVAIPDGMSRVDVAGYLADAGIYTTEGDMVHGMDGSDSRNEPMILKVVAHLGDSRHKYNPVALSQLAEAWPSSRTDSCELGRIGAYSFNEGGQLMANVSIVPFGGAPSLEVAYVAGVSLISNMYMAERVEAFVRFLLYPTITAIVHGLAAPEKLWFEKQSVLAVDASLLEAGRGLHSANATRSRTKLLAMEALAATPGELHQVSQWSFAFFNVNGTLDATARPTGRAEKGNNRVRTALTNAFKAESGVMTVLQRTSGISSEYTRLGKQVSDRLTCTQASLSPSRSNALCCRRKRPR